MGVFRGGNREPLAGIGVDVFVLALVTEGVCLTQVDARWEDRVSSIKEVEVTLEE